jgi:tetratricopeptide (TPR) repeat protein
VGEPRDPRIETLLAKVALAENAPDKAIEFVAPYAGMKDFDNNLSEAYLTAGNAYLAAGRNRDALTIFDWMASKAGGVPLILAAEGCGKALIALKDHAKAVEALDFAVRYAKTKLYDQVDLIKRIEALLAKARRLADIDLYGADFVLYRDGETLRREKGQFAKAREAYLEVIRNYPDGVYADASHLYAAECLVAIEKIPDAQKELMALRAADPYGLYAGEALLELGRIALVHHLQPQAAKGCFLLLDTWLREAREKPPLHLDKLVVKETAAKVTTPPAQEKYVDFWGNVKKNKIKPGQLVNRRTCPWYHDDLAEQCAMYLGFIAFTEGKKDEALAWYAKILDCDPMTRRMDTSGEWNDYSRLKWGAEHGYLYAYPDELKVYADPRQRLAVLLIDFYYVTQRWDMARNMAQRMLDGKAGPLTVAGRAYPQFALAAATFWSDGRAKAVPEYMKVLQGRFAGGWKTVTEYRAAYCAANLARDVADPKTQTQARNLLAALVRSPDQNEYTYKARITLAQDLVKEGHLAEGVELLKTFPDQSGPYKDLANYYLAKYAKDYAGKNN